MGFAKRWGMIFGLVGALVISGCGSSGDRAASEPEYNQEADVTTSYEDSADEYAGEAAEVSGSVQGSAAEEIDQKLIVTQALEVETAEFGAFMDTVNQKAAALGGYIQRSEISGSKERFDQSASLCIRIPAEKLSDFIVSVEENGTVVYNSKTAEDVTLQYVDTESRLNALKVEEETLLSLLEKAEKLSDIFAIQEELTEVRYQIESRESQLRVYDNQVNYSTVNLTVIEVARETAVVERGFWSEAALGFSNNLYSVGQAFRGFGVWFISCLPQFFVLGAAVMICWLVFRKIMKKRRKKDGEPDIGTEKKKEDGGAV